jgi:hypothetical protein
MATEAGDVVKFLKAARQDAIGFAFGVTGSGGELVAEKGKTGDQMIAVVKKLAGVKQSCGGFVRYNGTELNFVCDHPVPNFAKLAETWGKTNKFSFKAVVSAKQTQEAEKKDSEEDEEAGSVLFSLEQVKNRLIQAKTKKMFFAYGLGTNKGPNLLGLHPLKTGEKLMRIIRLENGAIKRAWGTATVDGSMVTFTCEDDPFPSMKRTLRRMLKEWKLQLRVTIIGPSGEFDETDEDEAEAETTVTETTTETGDTEIARLQAELAALLPALRQLFAVAPDQAGAIRHEYAECQNALKAGDVGAGARILASLRALSSEAPLGTVETELAALKDELDGLLPTLKELAKLPALNERIRVLWRDADTALKAGDVVGASAAIGELRTIETPADYKHLQVSWSEARNSAATDLKRLEEAILSEYSDAPEIDVLRQGLRKFDTILSTLGTEMADLFGQAANAALSERATLHSNARTLAGQYRSYIDGDALLAELDDNPFTPVLVKKRFAETLAQIEGALAA